MWGQLCEGKKRGLGDVRLGSSMGYVTCSLGGGGVWGEAKVGVSLEGGL